MLDLQAPEWRRPVAGNTMWKCHRPERDFTSMNQAINKQLEQNWWKMGNLTVSCTSMLLDVGRPCLIISVSNAGLKPISASGRAVIEAAFLIFGHLDELDCTKPSGAKWIDRHWTRLVADEPHLIGVVFVNKVAAKVVEA